MYRALATDTGYEAKETWVEKLSCRARCCRLTCSEGRWGKPWAVAAATRGSANCNLKETVRLYVQQQEPTTSP